ncbi:MAG: acyltransferase [Spirosomataceae bacterium]
MSTETKKNNPTDQIRSVNWIRGLAAFGVVEMHIFCALDFFSKEDVFFQKYIFPISIVGRLGVPVFFVISGFIIPYSMWKNQYKVSNFFNFMFRRLTRLEPPYLLAIILSVIVAYISTYFLKSQIYQLDWGALFLHFGYLNVFTGYNWLNPVFWTLAVEFQYYITIGLLFPLIMHRKYGNYFLILLLLILGGPLGYYLTPAKVHLVHYFHIFVLGIAAFKKHTKTISNAFFIPIVLISLGFTYNYHFKAYTVFSLITMLLILYNVDIKLKFMYFLGKISYSLYLLHWIVGMELMRNFYVHYFPITSQWEKLAVGLLIIGVSVFLSYIFYLVIEKPSMQWAKKIRPPKPKEPVVSN